MDKINAIMSVLKYDDKAKSIFDPILKISREDNKINISVLLSIVTSELEEQNLVIVLLHPKIIEDSESIKIDAAVLKEFTINKADDLNRTKVKNIIPQLQFHRSDLKFNLKNISASDNGSYSIILTDLTKEELIKNPNEMLDNVISAYTFEVE